MQIRATDRPQHPVLSPPHPQLTQVQPPMVYVYEKPRWEYKVIVQSAMTEEELNTLGASGWELVGVVGLPGTSQFYFKRARA